MNKFVAQIAHQKSPNVQKISTDSTSLSRRSESDIVTAGVGAAAAAAAAVAAAAAIAATIAVAEIAAAAAASFEIAVHHVNTGSQCRVTTLLQATF
jgi:hypothetical protein